MKSTKLTAVAVMLTILSLTGCASSSSTPETPTVISDEDEKHYEIEYIQVEGETIRCLWYNKGTQYGSMSCDWDNPVAE